MTDKQDTIIKLLIKLVNDYYGDNVHSNPVLEKLLKELHHDR